LLNSDVLIEIDYYIVALAPKNLGFTEKLK